MTRDEYFNLIESKLDKLARERDRLYSLREALKKISNEQINIIATLFDLEENDKR